MPLPADLTPVDYGDWLASRPAPTPPPRGALSEIATGGKRGLVVDLPEMLSQAGQTFTDNGTPIDDLLKSMEQSAAARGQEPQYTLHPDQHNVITNALAGGAEMVPQSLAVPLAAGGALALARVPAPIRNELAMGIGAAAPALSQWTQTYRSGIAAGLTDEQARAAALKTALIEGGGEYLGEKVMAPAIGIGSTLAGRALAPAASEAAPGFFRGAVVPWLGSTAETALGETATEMGQNYGEAAVEQNAGIPGQDPWESAKQAVGPTLGMTLPLAALGIPGYVMAQRAQAQAAAQQAPAVTAPPTAAAAPPAAAAATPAPQAAPPPPQDVEGTLNFFSDINRNGLPPDMQPPPAAAAPAAPATSTGAVDNTPYDRRTAEGVARKKQENGENVQVWPHPTEPGKYVVAPVAGPASALPTGYFDAQQLQVEPPQARVQTGAGEISDAELAGAGVEGPLPVAAIAGPKPKRGGTLTLPSREGAPIEVGAQSQQSADERQAGREPGGTPIATSLKVAKAGVGVGAVPRVADVAPGAKAFMIEGDKDAIRAAYPDLKKGIPKPGGIRYPAESWAEAKVREADLFRQQSAAKKGKKRSGALPVMYSRQESNDAVPEQGPDAGVLRQGRPEVGLRQVAEGNAQGRTAGAQGKAERSPAPEVEDIHKMAAQKGLASDNAPDFMDRTEEVTGQRHLDDLGPAGRRKMMEHLQSLPDKAVEGKPLDRINVKRPAVDKDGKRHEITQRADRALEDVDSQIKAVEEHLKCLRS